MCEHNLVIGKEYRLHADRGVICAVCGHNWPVTGGVLARYIGDDVINAHSFEPVQPLVCEKCQFQNGTIRIPCDSSGTPINVTQEFLSLPVRSRE